MREILDGLYHWSTFHDGIGQRVGSHYLEPIATVFDPRVPDEGLEAFEDLTEPSRVLLSARHHLRHASQFVEGFGAGLHAHRAGLDDIDREGLRSVAFDFGDEPATGVRALRGGAISADDTVFHLDVGPGALLFADAIHRSDGELGFFPDSLLGDDPAQVRADIVATLNDLVSQQQFDVLLFAHGDPVTEGGHEALDAFVRGFERQNR